VSSSSTRRKAQALGPSDLSNEPMAPSSVRPGLLSKPAALPTQLPKVSEKRYRIAVAVIITILLLSVFFWQWEAALLRYLLPPKNEINRVIVAPPDLWTDPLNQEGWAPCLNMGESYQSELLLLPFVPSFLLAASSNFRFLGPAKLHLVIWWTQHSSSFRCLHEYCRVVDRCVFGVQC
jgi:hypothetical protein